MSLVLATPLPAGLDSLTSDIASRTRYRGAGSIMTKRGSWLYPGILVQEIELVLAKRLLAHLDLKTSDLTSRMVDWGAK